MHMKASMQPRGDHTDYMEVLPDVRRRTEQHTAPASKFACRCSHWASRDAFFRRPELLAIVNITTFSTISFCHCSDDSNSTRRQGLTPQPPLRPPTTRTELTAEADRARTRRAKLNRRRLTNLRPPRSSQESQRRQETRLCRCTAGPISPGMAGTAA
jgi:hypothetical protein